MDEQQDLSLQVVNIHELQETMTVVKQILPFIEQQVPVFPCGGVGSKCHDVTICLVPNGMVSKGSGDYHREILTVVKVHSSRLSRCSKYFETCMTERWRKPTSTFLLETHTDIACYTDCFSRMYSSPFLKDFKDMEYSLKLLKVASQIQFHELMDSILLHISSKFWTDSDELMIRLYSVAPDFPRNHAQDLVVRLGMDESEKARHEKMCDVVEQLIHSALGHDGTFLVNRAFFKEILSDSGLSNGVDSYAMKDVIVIVSREAREMLVRVAEECVGQTHVSVPGFKDKISAICWILEALLAAKVAEEVVQCLVHLQVFPKILAVEPHAAKELANLVLVMYREVVAGNLLLKTSERVALLGNWHSLLVKHLTKGSYDQATKELFSTLPFSSQMELVKLRKDKNYEDFISISSLAKRLKKEWPAMELTSVVSAPSPSSQLGAANSLKL